MGRRCREGAARPAARPVAVGRPAADRQDRAGRRPRVVGGHRRVPPRPAVPGAVVGGAGRARHALPHVLAGSPAGGGHLRRGLPRLGRGSGARPRPGGDGRDAAAGVPDRPRPADRRGVHLGGDHRDRGAGHQRGQPGEPAVGPAAGHLRRRRHRPGGQPRRLAAAARPRRLVARRRGCPGRSETCWSGSPRTSGRTSTPTTPTTWLRRAREVDVRIDESWGLLRQAQESGRFNPRQRQRREHIHELETVLHLLEQAVAETQSMVRTIAISADQSRYWDEDFRSRWCALLADTGEAVGSVDVERLGELRTELQRLADDMSTDELRRRPVARVRRPDRQPAQRHRRGVPGRGARAAAPRAPGRSAAAAARADP